MKQRIHDFILELRITLAAEIVSANPSAAGWMHLTRLIRQRSPQQVARMEAKLGLR